MDFTHDALRKHTTARRTIFFVRMDRGEERALFKTCCTTSCTKSATVSGCARSCTMREKLSAKNGESKRQSKFQQSLKPLPFRFTNFLTRGGTRKHHIDAQRFDMALKHTQLNRSESRGAVAFTLCSMLRSSFSQISFRWGCNTERDCMIIPSNALAIPSGNTCMPSVTTFRQIL